MISPRTRVLMGIWALVCAGFPVLAGPRTPGEGRDGNDDVRRAGCLAVGDFDGDGVRDVAAVRDDPPSVVVLLGRGGGGFEPGLRLAVGAGPVSIAAGALDRDHRDDIAVMDHAARSVTVLLADGTGGFTVAGTVRLESPATSFGLGDVNGDGIADLVTVSDPARGAVVLAGDGAGRFGLPVLYPVIPAPSDLDSPWPSAVPALAGSLALGAAGAAPATPAAGPAVSSLILDPSTVQGGTGATSTGTVALTGPAPAGGQRVLLSSSNTDLAATPVSATVPAGQVSTTFTVATNPEYRKYSGLSFVATITASANGTSQSASLTVTAQPQPAPVKSDSCQREGMSCGGGSISSLGEYGILYRCRRQKPEDCIGPVSGQCSFQQECSLYCRTEPSKDGFRFEDRCGTAPPILVRLDPTYTEGGNSSTGTVTLSGPAPPDGATVGVFSPSPFVTLPPYNSITIPPGGTTTTFAIGTSAVGSPHFAKINVGVTTREELAGGGVFFRVRTQLAWLTLVQRDTCTPTICAAQSKNCGTIPDGCGGSLECGSCTAPETCGGGGVANVCGACSPTTCAAEGASCGTIPDGCGGSLDCGSCTPPETCGGGGTPNACGCTPATCSTLGAECGTVADRCGGTLDCGACPAPMTCGGSGTPNRCGGVARLAVSATGRLGERIRSSPAGIDVPVGQTQSADFAVGTTITLSATNNRDVVWSGVCSSGGRKTKTCTFTLQSNASETGNVQ